MKRHLKLSSYINWRKRVKQRQYKHRKKYALSQSNRRHLGFDLGLAFSDGLAEAA